MYHPIVTKSAHSKCKFSVPCENFSSFHTMAIEEIRLWSMNIVGFLRSVIQGVSSQVKWNIWIFQWKILVQGLQQCFGSGSGESGTFWVEAEAEAIFENWVEAEAEAETILKKKWKRKRKWILKKFGWKRKRKQFFFHCGSGSGSFFILSGEWKWKRKQFFFTCMHATRNSHLSSNFYEYSI